MVTKFPLGDDHNAFAIHTCIVLPEHVAVGRKIVQGAKDMWALAGYGPFFFGVYTFAVQGSSIFMNDPDAIFAREIRGTTPQWMGGGRGKYYSPPAWKSCLTNRCGSLTPSSDWPWCRNWATSWAPSLRAGKSTGWTATKEWDTGAKTSTSPNQGIRREHVWCYPACRATGGPHSVSPGDKLGVGSEACPLL